MRQVTAERARSANPLAGVALGSEREFSVDGGAAERAFGGVVGRFDAVDDGEGPERIPLRTEESRSLSVQGPGVKRGPGFGVKSGTVGGAWARLLVRVVCARAPSLSRSTIRVGSGSAT